MKEKISIVIAILTLFLLSTSASAVVGDILAPVYSQMTFVVITDTSFTVTLPSGQTQINFAGTPGDTDIDPTGQISGTPWARIDNTGDITTNFTVSLDTDSIANIVVIAGNSYDMNGSVVELDSNVQYIPGGMNLAPEGTVDMYIKADYSSVMAGTDDTFTNGMSIMNYMPVLTSMTVSGPSSVDLNTVVSYTAAGVDQYGNPMSVTVTWSSSNGAAGSISSTGPNTANFNSGNNEVTTTITATSGSITGSKSVSVRYVY